MTCSPTAAPLERLAAALQAGDLPRAQGILDQQPQPLPLDVARSVASQFMRHQHWQAALDLLQPHAEAGDPSVTLQTNLARNMLALREHRPAVYHAIHHTPARTTCQITRATGGLSIRQARPGHAPVLLCGPTGPVDHVERATKALAEQQRSAWALGLAGISDGHLLTWLAQHPAVGPLGQEQSIYVLEDAPELVAHAMMLHDWSGPEGPIVQPRFHWHVGPDAVEQWSGSLRANRFLPRPRAVASQGLSGPSLRPAMEQELRQAKADDESLRQAIHARVHGLADRHWIDLLGPQPPRQPRVLILTSRFTTVLQYSARDVADALQRLGFQTHILIEPSPHHRVEVPSILAALDQFQPDVLFALDHLRYELDPVLPKELPFICWIQDDLPNLTSREAGRSLGPRDFVLTWEKARYTELFSYPAERCIYMGKLTRVPARPATWRSDGDDLAYVSNASGRIDELQATLLATLGDEATAKVMAEACQRLRAVYDQGGWICSLPPLRRLLRQAAADLGLRPESDHGLELLVHKLEHPLNNALYRQQALRWVIAAASERGMTVALHGAGWDRHPEFAALARGPVAYGPELENLTRRSRINLQIVPFSCLHQRLLDGLVAGGFFLIRRHPLDDLAPRWFEFVRQLDPGIQSVEQARATLPPAQVEAMTRMVHDLSELDDRHNADAIAAVRQVLAQGVAEQFQPLPGYDEVSFADAASLGRCLDRFAADADARRHIAEAQRRFVESHLTYDAGMARMVGAIHRRLSGARP